MAVLGQITVNEISILEVDNDPSVNPVDAPVGSFAIDTNGLGFYQKVGNGNTDWVRSVPLLRRVYRVIGNNTNTTPNFVSANIGPNIALPNGLYHFYAYINHTSQSTGNGIGVRINTTGTFGNLNTLWLFTGGTTTNGATNLLWQRLQIATNDNYFAPNSVTSTNSIVSAHGLIEVTAAGVPVLEFRSENNGQAVTILPNSFLLFERIE